MCGLAGIFTTSPSDRELALERVRVMCEAMVARGPDAVGYWADPDGQAALGLRRLAIIDLDPRSDQPMVSADGRYVIVFNGEIYNYRELRAELERDGAAFRTESDTEVVLALFAHRGAGMLASLRGMFALCILDTATKGLFLARDPYGIKPLYIGKADKGIVFASQVKAILATGAVSREPNAVGQAGFWLLGSVPEPHTWFRDIRQLPAGCYATVSADGRMHERAWFDVGVPFGRNPGARAEDARDIALQVREALAASVDAHMVADVPAGIFLSGGIDSGSVAGLIADSGRRGIAGITLSFPEFQGHVEDEAPVAGQIARHYGLDHHVRIVTYREFEEDLPRILASMDQPTVDGINTWYASKAAAEIGLKVVLSGVGGDELFQGYSSFTQLPRAVRAWHGLRWLPGVRTVATAAFRAYSHRARNPRWALVPRLMSCMEGAWFLRRGLFAPSELPRLMQRDLYEEAVRQFHPIAFVQGMTGPLPRDSRMKLSQIESMTYLRNQLLRDSDWASMAHSVELRTPLVDARLLLQMAPFLGRMGRFPQKSLLADAPSRPLPQAVRRRPKTGFGIPTAKWLENLGLANSLEGMSRGWAHVVAERVYAG